MKTPCLYPIKYNKDNMEPNDGIYIIEYESGEGEYVVGTEGPQSKKDISHTGHEVQKKRRTGRGWRTK